MWHTMAELVAMGYAGSTIRSRYKAGKIERRQGKVGYEYKLEASDDRRLSSAECIESDDRQVIYDAESGVYLFVGLVGQPKLVRVKRELIDRLLREYSREGGDKTANVIARELGIPRRTVLGMLRALGKTHDSAPFSDEVIASEEEGELVESLLKMKEERVLTRAQKERYKRESAELDARSFMRRVVSEAVERPTIWKPHRGIVRSSADGCCVVFGLTDLHIGKRGIDGYCTEEACRRAINCIGEGIERAQKMWGQVDEWVIMCGSDMMNFDTNSGTTSKGTIQDVDVSPREQLSAAYSLMLSVVEMIRRAEGRVRLVCVSGNHDTLMSMSLGLMLQAVYDGAEDVSVEVGVEESVYVRYGKSLMGFNHGDKIDLRRLPALMASERAADWGECRGAWEWFTGHRHVLDLKVNEDNGCRVWTLPSLSGVDRWHKGQGYGESRLQLAMFKVVGGEGVVGVELIKHH